MNENYFVAGICYSNKDHGKLLEIALVECMLTGIMLQNVLT